MRLPTVGELLVVIRGLCSGNERWSTDLTDATDAVSVDLTNGFAERLTSASLPYRCISNPRPESQLN